MSFPSFRHPLLLSFLCALAPLEAQSTAGLKILWLDEASKPLTHKVLMVESLDRGTTRSLKTDAKGKALASGLLPGRYRVMHQDVLLVAGEQAQLTLRGGLAQATVMVEDSPLRTESSSLATQTTLLAQDIQTLPIGQRYVEHSYLVSGVTPSGNPEPVVLGSMLDANAFVVDGMATNLSNSGRFGLNLSSEILESQTFTTGGHKAEIAFASGGVFSMVTKSGGNTFHGSLFGSRIWPSLNSAPHPGKTNAAEDRTSDASIWGMSASGPIIKDKLFFFTAFNRQLYTLKFENVRPLGLAPRTREQREDREYRFMKLTYLVNPDHRLELAWFGDPVLQTNFESAQDVSLKDEQMPNRTRGGNSFLLKHTGALSPWVTLENTLGLHQTDYEWTPAMPQAGPYREQLDAPGQESFGAYKEERLQKIRNITLKSEATCLWGAHQIKGGFQLLESRFTLAYRRPSFGLSYLDRVEGAQGGQDSLGPASGDLDRIREGLIEIHGSDFNYQDADSLLSPSPVSGQLVGGEKSYLFQRTLSSLDAYGDPLKRLATGLFIQDDWALNPYWTLNLGARLDYVTLHGEDGRKLYGETLFSPRLGVSWDPSAKGLIRCFAYAGRIYSPLMPGSLTAAGATTGGPATQREVWIPALSQWKAFERTGVKGVKNVAVADLKASHTDLFQLGVERFQELPWLGKWIFEAVFTKKRIRNLVDTYASSWGYLPELKALADTSAVRRVIANLPGLKRDYLGADLTVHRRFEGGYRLQFSYAYGDLQGNSEVGDVAAATAKDTGFASLPSLRQDYRDARYDGYLNENVRHAFKAFGALPLKWGFEVSGAYQIRSGLHYSDLVKSGGDLVLAPGARRGQRRLPRAACLDLALAYTWKLGITNWRAAVECYNATNQQPMTTVNNIGSAFAPGLYQQGRSFQFSLRGHF